MDLHFILQAVTSVLRLLSKPLLLVAAYFSGRASGAKDQRIEQYETDAEAARRAADARRDARFDGLLDDLDDDPYNRD